MVKKSLLVLIFVSLVARVTEKGDYERSELVNGKTFTSKVVWEGDVFQKSFLINEEAFDEKDFYENRQAAITQEALEAHECMQALAHEEQTVDENARAHLFVKLIKKIKNDFEQRLNILKNAEISDFFAFNSDTIEQESFDRLHPLLQALSFCEDEKVYRESSDLLKNLYEKLTSFYAAFLSFYGASINNAVEQSDDPESLKKLLELV